MSWTFTDINIIDEFTGAGGGGVPYVNGGVLAKHVATIKGYFYLAYKEMFLRFDTDDNSITNLNDLDFRSFFDDGTEPGKGLAKGRTITVVGTAGAGPDNDGEWTIDSISDDGRTIYTVENLNITQDKDGVDIYDTTPITAIDFYYNLVENASQQESYLSLTDREAIQRFSADDVDASNTTPVNMIVASASMGWVTNELTNPDTGETDEVTVEGIEIADYKQYFKIIQTFRVAPFGLAGQINNFKNLVAPDYFRGGNALKYICRVDGKFDYADPSVPHTSKFRSNVGVINASGSGLTCWYNENNIRSRAEYYHDSTTFYILGNVKTGIDINKVTSVTAVIKSLTGKFDNTNTKFAIDFVYLPLNESRYINTPNTTLLQNFLNDRYFGLITSSGDGEQSGTAYQVIKNVSFVFVDAYTVQVKFDTDFSDEIKELFESLPIENRNYFVCVTTQDQAGTSTKQIDRVPVLVPLAQVNWDKSNPELIQAVDNLRAYPFPQIGTSAFTSISGYEGDPFYVEFPIRLLGTPENGITPTLMNAGFQIVLKKSGEENFVLEEKIFDTSIVRKLNGVQTINISEAKNFQDMPDEYNVCSIVRDESYDEVAGSGSDEADMYGFVPHYSGILRYDFWHSLVNSNERLFYDIFKDLESPTEAWGLLAQHGWELKLRFVAQVKGYTDLTETFEAYWAIEANTPGTAPEEGPEFTSTVMYVDVKTDLITNGITKGGKTLITRTYEGDFSSLPSGFNSLYAYIFADYQGGGGLTVRRFASTEYDSQTDSPFTAPSYLPSYGLVPDHSWASANVRISTFGTSKVIVQTIYDDSANNWSNVTDAILLYPKLGFMAGCFMRTEGGGYMLNEKGQRILLENCEDEGSS